MVGPLRRPVFYRNVSRVAVNDAVTVPCSGGGFDYLYCCRLIRTFSRSALFTAYRLSFALSSQGQNNRRNVADLSGSFQRQSEIRFRRCYFIRIWFGHLSEHIGEQSGDYEVKIPTISVDVEFNCVGGERCVERHIGG